MAETLVPDSHIDRVTALQNESPCGSPGSVKIVEFTLFGHPFMAISAGPLDPFNHAGSFMVKCDCPEEFDHYWPALLEGGAPKQCGWLKDKYGLCGLIVPTRIGELMTDPDKAKAKRVGDAMMKMIGLDISQLEKAAAGN